MTGQEASGLKLIALQASLRAYAEQLPTVLSVPNLVATITEAADTVAALVAERDDWKHDYWNAKREGAERELKLRAELERAVAERDSYRDALEEIATHIVVSEGEFPDDNCDWHCTLTMQARARDALAVSA